MSKMPGCRTQDTPIKRTHTLDAVR